MIIYASPKTGKSSFCNDNIDWLDGDKILFDMLEKAFHKHITDNDTKGDQIIELFKINRVKAEKCYTKYMEWIKDHKYTNNVMIGSRRFMWLADKIFIKHCGDSDITYKEIESINKWRLKYTLLNKDQFITHKLLNTIKI